MMAAETSKVTKTIDPYALMSPRDIAEAIGASESSLRRWIDSGDLRVFRTSGGHRRVPLREAIRFIRKIGAPIVHPEALYLPRIGARRGGSAEGSVSAEEDAFFAALSEGRGDVANALAISCYLHGSSMHQIFDGPLKGAMHRVGQLWNHSERGILVEHRATALCLAVVVSLRSLVPSLPESAPVAIGGAPAGDPYQLPTLMAATVLAEAGFRDINYGANTPLALLGREAELCDARLVWLSISHAPNYRSLQTDIEKLAAALARQNSTLVIGGRACAEFSHAELLNSTVINSMGELAGYARGLLRSPERPHGRARKRRLDARST